TTSKVPDGLSTTFADNVGANETVVYSGALNFFLTAPGAYIIPLQTPFLFDPTTGNLLMDVRNFQPGPSPVLGGNPRAFNEAEVTLGDSVSVAFAGDVNDLTGRTSTSGLVTGFGGTIVPEPSTVVMLVLGLVGYALAWRKKTRRITTNMTKG